MQAVGSINSAFELELQDGEESFEVEDDQIAVQVRDARVSLGEIKALDGVNLSVPKGCIYALLGPSGCGKTTLLSSLLDLQPLTEGEVRVFGSKPGSQESGVPGAWVGYMPQDLSLYPDLSIQQTLSYFGHLQRSNPGELKQRINFLLKILDLPDRHRLTMNLSGGEQRRLSLAVALIHRPPLLLLDEPTVGVDPVLRETIWDHLVQLTVEEGLTIIITTHYIEEARKAHMVAFMREGRILVERNPEKLISEQGATRLEEVFHHYCVEDEKERSETSISEDCITSIISIIQKLFSLIGMPDILPLSMKSEGPVQNELEMKTNQNMETSEAGLYKLVPVAPECKDHLRIIRAISAKSFHKVRMNLGYWLIVFLIPIACVMLLKELIGFDPTDLKIAVFNKEYPRRGSKLFLDKLDKNVFRQVEFTSEDDFMHALKYENFQAVVSISENFSIYAFKRLHNALGADAQTLRGSQIHFKMVDNNPVFTVTVFRALAEALKSVTADTLRGLGATTALASIPLEFPDPVVGKKTVPTFGEFLAAGFVCDVIYIVSLLGSGMTFTEECNARLFNRSRAAGVRVLHLIIAQVALQYMASFIQVSTMLIYIKCSGIFPDPPLAMVAFVMFFQTSLGIAHGIFIASISPKSFIMLTIVAGLQCFNFAIAGLVWPIEAMPTLLKIFSIYFGPDSAMIRAMRLILYHGQGLTHVYVWQACLISSFWIVATYSALVAFFNLRKLILIIIRISLKILHEFRRRCNCSCGVPLDTEPN